MRRQHEDVQDQCYEVGRGQVCQALPSTRTHGSAGETEPRFLERCCAPGNQSPVCGFTNTAAGSTVASPLPPDFQ